MARHARRQGGWIGLIVILIALAIVALLGKTLLKQLGLIPGGEAAAVSGERARGPGIGAAPVDNTGATPTPGQAIDPARNLGQTLQQEAEDIDRKVDGK